MIVLAAPVPPTTIAASRVAITALVWTAIAAATGVQGSFATGVQRSFATGDRDVRRRVVLSGVLLGVHFALWIVSLTLTSVAHGAVLVVLQPLFAALFGLFLGDRASWRLVVGVAIALVGTAWMTQSDEAGATFTGDLLAVLAGACAAAYLVVNRGVAGRIPLAPLLALVNAIAGVTVLAWIVVSGAPWWHDGATVRDALAVVWLGLGPGFLGHGSMNWAARWLPVHVVSLAVLLEPVGAAFLALWLLGQSFGAAEVVGAALLLIGAAIALRR